ncbi:MAG: type IV secretion system protein VirB10 [Sphingomonas sp.]|nr:type IV secretion system protein VirB10 [Sphingomonas sp.]
MSDATLVKRPVVAKAAKPPSVIGATVGLSLLGIGIFIWLAEARAASEGDASGLPALSVAATTPAPAQPPLEAAAVAPAEPLFIPNSGPVTLVSSNPRPDISGFSAPRRAPVLDADSDRQRSASPALIVDLALADISQPPGTARTDGGMTTQAPGAGPAVAAPAPGAATVPADRNLSETEQFSARVGSQEVEVARARRMTNLDRLVPQGAVIGAVMETALNSDLPGFARALVQRDVYSFDGTAVLVPAGSRLIGQYKSGVAQGASRVFVLWTRLIRPDGVSIELASPATDDLGRAGIGGKVNRHFFQRFGGAILTSVLTGGLNALAARRGGGSTIIVGSAGQATALASQATQSSDIPPTITTKQGANVRIFVARDLDFSQVGPAG